MTVINPSATKALKILTPIECLRGIKPDGAFIAESANGSCPTLPLSRGVSTLGFSIGEQCLGLRLGAEEGSGSGHHLTVTINRILG
jgi:hypothetical protein